MNCLICGHKLAIFRKLSLGDFCCQEHRALFSKEQSDRGLARLMETNGDLKSRGFGTRVYAQFMLDEAPPNPGDSECLAHGPLTPAIMTIPAAQGPPAARFAPPRFGELVEFVAPHPGLTRPIGFGVAGLSLRLPSARHLVQAGGEMRLRKSGLILPWSTGAGSNAVFSLAPLAAAAWAQSGFCKPIASPAYPAGALQFCWPRIEARVELPPAVVDIAPAALAVVSAAPPQPMRVRLATPRVAKPRPRLELILAARVEDCPAVPELSVPAPPVQISVAPPRRSLFATIFAPQPRLPVVSRSRQRDGDERYAFDEAPKRPSSGDGWSAMLQGWTPSAAGVSALFAVLFLFSAIAIFLSAPSNLSDRAPSFKWSILQSAIRNRAVLKVEDDFRAGLSGWTFPTGWAQDWSYDQAGFLRPGKLGFLDESMKLVNYRLELMGQIERKSLGWAFRAQDSKNYYVAKLTIARPGPLPMVDLIHYPVLNGKEGAKIRVSLPFAVRNDTLYQVEMNVRGDQFRASVNGHVVTSWSDNSLRAGGVGFVSGQGEAARVRWIRVSDRDDVLGRVCSYLSARSYQPSEEPTLSASYYAMFKLPGL